MSKSKIITEFVCGNINLESALLRLKVILYNFNSKEINSWIENELNGYKEDDLLPDYRLRNGFPYGKIIAGSMMYSNIQLPIHHLDENVKENLLRFPIYTSVSSLYDLLDKEENLKSPIPLEILNLMSQGLSHGDVATGSLKLGSGEISSTITTIKNKVLDILLNLEKEFGCLDEMDVMDDLNLSEEEKGKLERTMINIIFNRSIKIGDKNKIENNVF